ncbi:MAG: hypothetical protein HY898_05230 [Deltaproteobacteria bacterium]|nr:hypothetical protein [Deltaproteobacteria bacterium]
MQQPIRPIEVSLVFSTPRKLPRARDLVGRVVVLDLAFASEASAGGFLKITLPFIEALGPRLAAWVDHHDHAEHARFKSDSRFVLATKAEHGALPEMITPELVAAAGVIDTLVCHTDFDGLASAAKWMRGGMEPYPGCDADARAIDTRLGTPSEDAATLDRALRARPRDQGLFGIVVRHLATGLADPSLWVPIREAADQMRQIEDDTRRLALGFVRLDPGVSVIDISGHAERIDKTLLLLLGQSRERIAVVIDAGTINMAARFDSGVDLLRMMGLSGGMPTRISVDRSRLDDMCKALGVRKHELEAVLIGQ